MRDSGIKFYFNVLNEFLLFLLVAVLKLLHVNLSDRLQATALTTLVRQLHADIVDAVNRVDDLPGFFDVLVGLVHLVFEILLKFRVNF